MRKENKKVMEFGIKLKTAREAKGMTQQSLAEKLFVTRQAVSRWECGDRFPDLIMCRKISDILDVKIDDLLSENDASLMVERNQIVEDKKANSIINSLYAFISFSYVTKLTYALLKLPMAQNVISVQELGEPIFLCNLISWILRLFAFVSGLICSVKHSLSPKKNGAVIELIFGTVLLADIVLISTVRKVYLFAEAAVVIAGIAAVYLWFFKPEKYNKSGIIPCLITVVSVLETIHSTASVAMTMIYAGEYISMQTALDILSQISMYSMIIYQTYILKIKRKNTIM